MFSWLINLFTLALPFIILIALFSLFTQTA